MRDHACRNQEELLKGAAGALQKDDIAEAWPKPAEGAKPCGGHYRGDAGKLLRQASPQCGGRTSRLSLPTKIIGCVQTTDAWLLQGAATFRCSVSEKGALNKSCIAAESTDAGIAESTDAGGSRRPDQRPPCRTPSADGRGTAAGAAADAAPLVAMMCWQRRAATLIRCRARGGVMLHACGPGLRGHQRRSGTARPRENSIVRWS